MLKAKLAKIIKKQLGDTEALADYFPLVKDNRLLKTLKQLETGVYYVVLVGHLGNGCPLVKKIGDANALVDLITACYGDEVTDETTKERHFKAFDSALELLGFNDRKFTIRYTKRDKKTGFVDWFKVEKNIKPLTEFEALTLISKRPPTKLDNFIYSWELYEYTAEELETIDQGSEAAI